MRNILAGIAGGFETISFSMRASIIRSDARVCSLTISVKKLGEMRNFRCHATAGEIAQSLVGNYRQERLFSLKQAAVSVERSQSELGAFHRRKRSQKGPASAATATAHKIARLY